MSTLPGKKRAYQDHLRYKHMVARLSGLPTHKQEAVLIAELARGRRWRIDAAIESLWGNPDKWPEGVRLDDVFKMIGRYGRLTAFSRMAEILELEPFPHSTAPAWKPAREPALHRCFEEAVIHGHYRVADACWHFGGRTNVYLDPQQRWELPRAMNIAINEKDFAKIDYLLARRGDASYSLTYAVMAGDLSVVRHLLDRGADPDYKAEGTWGMLQLAVKCNRYDVFDLLVSRGADVTINADEMYHALMWRKDDISAEVAKLRAAGVPVSAATLEDAAQAGKSALFATPEGKKRGGGPKP